MNNLSSTAPNLVPVLDRRMVEAGVPLDALQAFAQASGLTLAEVGEVVIPPRTLKHRRSRNEELSREESDKFARLVRLYRLALSVFGNQDKALWWLREPQLRFDETFPLRLLQTEVGGRDVEEALIQIDEGIFV